MLAHPGESGQWASSSHSGQGREETENLPSELQEGPNESIIFKRILIFVKSSREKFQLSQVSITPWGKEILPFV